MLPFKRPSEDPIISELYQLRPWCVTCGRVVREYRTERLENDVIRLDVWCHGDHDTYDMHHPEGERLRFFELELDDESNS